MNSQEFPKTLLEAMRYFEDKDVAVRFVTQIRWPEGVTCPLCGTERVSFVKTRRIWNCLGCKKQFSVKVGSVMEDSPLGLDKWLAAIWLITGAKNGISSCEVARALGVTQKTAWFLLHRVRLAMQQGSFELLGSNGTPVEVDETFIGGKARNMHKDKKSAKIKGRGTVGKTIVLGLLERGKGDKKDKTNKQVSKVHAKVIINRERATLHPEVRAHVEPGSQVFSDEHGGYVGLEEYEHQVVTHAEAYVDGIVHTNGLENFWTLLKRSLGGTYVSVEPFHLFRYLDEQSFRFNERKDTDQGRFLTVAGNVAGKRLTYKKLIGKEGAPA